MNLYFLVEGEQTERKVYRAWLGHVFPHLKEARTIEQVESDCFFILAGYGQPGYQKRIQNAVADILAHGKIDHFFICVDAETDTLAEKVSEVYACLPAQAINIINYHIIVHNCCIETWFLGHRKILRRNPESSRLREFREFYDVGQQDPELMECHPAYGFKAQFHLEYLKEMLREQNVQYTKAFPRHVVDQVYLRALVERYTQTSHLQSFGRLFTLWQEMGGIF